MTQNKLTKRLVLAAVVAAVLIGSVWFWRSKSSNAETKKTGPAPVLVVTARATQSSVPVKLTATGTVSPVQQVDIRPQVTSTVSNVHIKEGQTVRRGDLLFSLDARADEANIRKADAQLAKSRSDLANARRNLDRQRELFNQKFISQAALDQAQNEYEVLQGQLAVDQAGAEGTRVTRGYQEIRAPFAGRTGVVQAFPGTLVQPNSVALVSITQLDPINVSFNLPERELANLQAAMSKGEVPVTALINEGAGGSVAGKISFIDNAVDTTTGTIRVKAQFANADGKLWPGMFVNVALAPRTLDDAITVPAQSVQTGPERKFIYVADAENKVASKPVQLLAIQDGQAAVSGIKPGDRVVVEGAQNLRPGSTIAERKKEDNAGKPGKGGKEGKSEGKGEGKGEGAPAASPTAPATAAPPPTEAPASKAKGA
jgi:RND family efflux transporter MFP subunit